MSLVKFKTHPQLRNGFEDLFQDFFEGEFFPRTFPVKTGSIPSANVKETEASFIIELAAPGMRKEDFNVEVEEDLLSVKTERQEEKEDKTERYAKREFNYNSFVRSFRLPEQVDIEKISASYKDGVLALEIPKIEEEVVHKTRRIEIQ